MSNVSQQTESPFAQADDVSIRRMRDDMRDYLLMSKWLMDDRVLEFYAGRDKPHNVEKVMLDYGPGARGEDVVIPCILNWRKKPVGFIQYYPLTESESHQYGVDMFIGEPTLWSQGLGTRALRCLIDCLFNMVNASRVVIDPHVSNHRAIRSYENSGFRKFKLLPKHERHEGEYRDSWLMTIDREQTNEHNTVRPDSEHPPSDTFGCIAPDSAVAESRPK